METRFTSLDRQTSTVVEYDEPQSAERIAELSASQALIARGAGVSYVAASFGSRARSIGMSRLNRVLSFDAPQRRITVEAGMSLGALYSFLLPHKLYLPTQPGHPQISIGGCVACNVHGKNPQRDGLFSDLVENISLFHPQHGVMLLSREQHADIFDLTCGGFGLTGLILAVTLRLTPLPASVVELRKVPVGNLAETFDQLDELKLDHDFLYSWNDLSTFGRNMGRGYVVVARFVSGDPGRAQPLPSYPRLKSAPPQGWRPKVLHAPLIPWVTRVHFHWQMQRRSARVGLFEMLYPGMHAPYYFNLYGRDGFFAHMILLPQAERHTYLHKLESILRTYREPMIATAIKAFAGRQRLLHFNGTGYSMHFHIGNTTRGRQLLAAMEDLSRDFHAIRSLYFDSRLTSAGARVLYPEYDSFKQRLHQFDPQRLFASDISRRLDL